MEPESARRLLDLQLDGIREAPVGIVVCCDRRTPAAGVLGRATFPDADLWSCACAIENMWLAARAEGLGVGWVTLFHPDELAALLGLPDGVETLGWLCVGWPDERPPSPGLERAGWSRRAPLSSVVLHERWSDQHTPPPSHLRSPTQSDVVAARDNRDDLLTPPASLGVLDNAVDRIAALRHPHATDGVLVLVGADHPVTQHGVSPYDSSVTTSVLTAAVVGDAFGTAAATAADLRAIIVDAGVGDEPISGAINARPVDVRGDLVSRDALGEADVERLLAHGTAIGRDAARCGLVALGEVGVGNTTVAAALVCVLLDLDADDVVGLGSGADSAMLQRKRAAVTAAIARARAHHGAALSEPLTLLRALGGPEFTVLAGVTLGAALGGAAIVLDGLATSVAAAVALGIEPAVAAHLVAGQRSRESAHPAVLQHLGLEPLLDLRIRAGEGVAATFAVQLLRAAVAARAATARSAPSGGP